VNDFVQRYGRVVIGTLSGFDRVLFRGTHRMLANVAGLMAYLCCCRVLLKDFGGWAQQLTDQVRLAGKAAVERAGRPVIYLGRSSSDKEQMAWQIASRDGIDRGSVCLLESIEPFWGYELSRSREQKKLLLRVRQRQCVHQYHYLIHPQLGWMHVRVQTWLPFTVKLCVNGREWLCRSLEKSGVDFERRENCLSWVRDVAKAQRMLDGQLRTNWPKLLGGIVHEVNPSLQNLLELEGRPLEYYWSADQSEWASDVMFKDAASLSSVYPSLIDHGIRTLGSREVMRFLGKRVSVSGPIRGNAEVVSDLSERVEGVRLKHRVNGNSVKMYDKQGSVLRVETTINQVRGFRVWRGTEAEPDKKQWRHLRKGVADVHRRAKVSQACNGRYLSMLATVQQETKLGELIGPLCRGKQLDGQPVRALCPFDPSDQKLLEIISRGEFAINGLRNRDVREQLYGPDDASSEPERRRRSAAVTRRLRLLRGHGLLRKVKGTHRYQLTARGRSVVSALSAAKSATTQQLAKLAA
jgi:hypothetical protein